MPDITGVLSAGYPVPKNHGMRIVPNHKNERHDAYGAPVLQDPRTAMQSFAGSSSHGAFEAYAETPGVYAAYAGPSYVGSSQHPKQVPSTPLGSSIGYASYYQVQDSGPACRTTTPATDWMRWSQANLNPFAQHTQPDFMSPTAATTLMSMSDTRSTSAAPARQPEEQHQQWPFNYYNGDQYATTHPG